MPPPKPSPHRFIPPVPAAQTPNPKPKSNLRHVVGLNTPEVRFKKITPLKRFVLASTRREYGGEAQTEHHVRPRAGMDERVEDVVSSPSRVNDDEITQSIEHTPRPDEEEDDEEDDLLFDTTPAPKRRRTSPPPPHRFRAPPPPPTTATINPSRPSFILPAPRSPPKPTAQNLPEVFSPSRKAQKYTPHGLAASVQAWIVDAAQQGSAGGIVWGREREEGVRVKIRIGYLGGRGDVECWPGGTTLMGGEMEGQDVRVVLAGCGGARGGAAVKIRVGSVVGVRAPMWEVDVCGETWVVGVEWVVLC